MLTRKTKKQREEKLAAAAIRDISLCTRVSLMFVYNILIHERSAGVHNVLSMREKKITNTSKVKEQERERTKSSDMHTIKHNRTYTLIKKGRTNQYSTQCFLLLYIISRAQRLRSVYNHNNSQRVYGLCFCCLCQHPKH